MAVSVESPMTSDAASHQAKLEATQKKQDAVSVYFARQVSRYLTPAFLLTPISANQATAVWGLLSLTNTWVIYLAMTGRYWLVPLVFLNFFLVVVVDCVDGEIARYRQTASPIGGKLLDGVWHKATEYGLLIAYTAAVFVQTGTEWILPMGLIMLSGEAMYTYVYERRLTVIRVYAKSSEYINPTTPNDLYTKGERFWSFSREKKLNALRGLIQYKSVYFMIGLSWISIELLQWGLVILTAYKHFAWMKLLVRTVNNPPRMPSE